MKTEDLPIPNLGLMEIALIQAVFCAVLWLLSDYAATLLSIIFPVIFTFLLIIALLSELIDRSKIPRKYFFFMVISIVIPIITALVFVAALGANFDWTKA